MAAALQADVVIVRHAVVAMHFDALLEEETGEVEADKARRSGDEDARHADMPFAEMRSRMASR